MTWIKRVFSSKIFYLIFSILASLTIWMYVEYIENPDVSVTLRGIRVEFLNEDYVTDRGLIITGSSTDTVSARFTGKRNIVSQLTNTKLSATVDLAEVDTVGQYQRTYTIHYPPDTGTPLPTYTNVTEYVTVVVDKLGKKDIPVRCAFSGSIAEGYRADTPTSDPSTLSVTGPQNVLNRISYAWVSLDRQNVSKTIDDNLPFILMDEDGHEVVSDKLTLSVDTVHVKMLVLMKKVVPLTVNLLPGAGADETNTKATIDPSSISLSGDAGTLEPLNQITLATIDLSKLTMMTSTQTYDIVIPNDTTNLNGVTTARVTVTITGLDSRHYSVTNTNIAVSNAPVGYTTEIVTTAVDVVLRGKPESLDKIIPENIRIVADLSELGSSTGVYSVPAKIYVDGDAKDVGPIADYKITVMLTKE